MTDEEKIKVIESMGIDWKGYCPDDYKIKQKCTLPIDGSEIDNCAICWIKSLEE